MAQFIQLDPNPASRSSLCKRVRDASKHVGSVCSIPVTRPLSSLDFINRPFDEFQIRQYEFEFNHGSIRARIAAGTGHDNRRIVKASNHVTDGIHFSDVLEEFVPESLTLRGPLYQPGDVYEFNDIWYDALREKEFRNPSETTVRNFHDPDVWIDRAKGIILRRNRDRRQGVKQCGFADIRQPDDSYT
jgi:hypothetical protein